VGMSQFEVDRLITSKSLTVRHVRCSGACRHRSAEECSTATHLVFPHRGVFVRHVGQQEIIADANQVLFFNASESYQVSHPVTGGDSNFVVELSDELLRELTPPQMLIPSGPLRFRQQHRRIDSNTQALIATLRYALTNRSFQYLAAEASILKLVSSSLGPRTSHEPRATPARRRLVNRVKLLLMETLGRRWKLAEIAAEVGASPVYLTQLFQHVEGLPLHRYHLRLRLARSLERLLHREDLSTVALELGFSSHSHFSLSFKQTYGLTPSQFRQSVSD